MCDKTRGEVWIAEYLLHRGNLVAIIGLEVTNLRPGDGTACPCSPAKSDSVGASPDRNPPVGVDAVRSVIVGGGRTEVDSRRRNSTVETIGLAADVPFAVGLHDGC